jgi:hypothetical protein
MPSSHKWLGFVAVQTFSPSRHHQHSLNWKVHSLISKKHFDAARTTCAPAQQQQQHPFLSLILLLPPVNLEK